MNAVINILSRILGKIPARGTLMTPSGYETYPIAICNEIMGGPFIVNSIAEMKEIPVERLLKGCKCIVNEHTTDGKIQTTTNYMLKNVPLVTLSITETEGTPTDISEFWVLDIPKQQEESAVQYQYAPDYINYLNQKVKPPFMSYQVSTDAYNDGYATTADFDAGDTSKIIWFDEYDVDSHVWVRQRNSGNADWGIPMRIDEAYSEGSYNDVRFQWRDKALGAPARPKSMIDGKVNNEPAGWTDVPTIPTGESYTVYVELNDLWRIGAIKNSYMELTSEWSEPIKISSDSNLVRYGIDATSKEFYNDLFWRPYYSLDDRYIATRATIDDEWVIELITGESGEYKDMVFKEFQSSYEPTIEDAPKTKLGYGTDDWYDGVFVSQDGYTLHVSTCRKYSTGEQITSWSIPVRFDGKSTIRNVINTGANTGSSFRYKMSEGVQTITPSTIILKSVLYDANKEVDITKYTTKWYKGTVDQVQTNQAVQIVKGAPLMPQISGTSDTELTVSPDHVLTKQVFTSVIYLEGEDYFDEITIYDVTDGIGYVPLMDSDKGYIYKGTDTKTFTGYLFENGKDISDAAGITYTWDLGGVVTTERTIAVNDTQVVGSILLNLTIGLNGNNYVITESLVDVADGKSVERQYSALDPLVSMTYTPDTTGNPNQWSTNAANTVWVIERVSGEDWNTPYRVKGEKGTPNGAFQKIVYRLWNPAAPEAEWRYTTPTTRTDANSALVPEYWTENPASDAPTGSTIYGSKTTFLKNPATESPDELVVNWNIQSTGWSAPFKVTYFAEDGIGTVGDAGVSGWTPTFAVVDYGEKRILQVKDYVGGGGTKPAGVGWYVGADQLYASISSGVDIRGAQGATGPEGAGGIFNASDFWDGDMIRLTSNTMNGNQVAGSAIFKFRKAKNGMVYYKGQVYSNPNIGNTLSQDIQLNNNSDWNTKMRPMDHWNGLYTGISVVLNWAQITAQSANTGLINPTSANIGTDVRTNRAFIFRRNDTPTYVLRYQYVKGWVGLYEGCYMSKDLGDSI